MVSIINEVFTEAQICLTGKNVVDHSVEPVCQLYRGTRCQKYVGNKTVYIPSNLTQKMLEEKVNVAFTVIENSK